MEFDFDENGQPQRPTMMCNPLVFEKVRKWEVTDEQKVRLAAIVEKKRLAWREREGNRKLVG
jgi:hypothetical protein